MRRTMVIPLRSIKEATFVVMRYVIDSHLWELRI